MKHIHKKTGVEYEVGKLVDFDGKSFDITVITLWPDTDSMVVVDYYFGDYSPATTDFYIDRYNRKAGT